MGDEPELTEIEAFLERQRGARYSYREVGRTRDEAPPYYKIDHNRARLGTGEEAYRVAVAAMRQWKMFDLGWVRIAWPGAPIQEGTNVAVVARTLGIWSLNAARIVYTLDGLDTQIRRFGFAYGTLLDHAETGEERFSVEWTAGWSLNHGRERDAPYLSRLEKLRERDAPYLSCLGKLRERDAPSLSCSGKLRERDAPSLSRLGKLRERDAPYLSCSGKLRERDAPSLSCSGKLRERDAPSLSRLGKLRERDAPSLSCLGKLRERDAPSLSCLGKLRERDAPSLPRSRKRRERDAPSFG